MAPTITRIENVEFSFPLENVGKDETFNLIYEPGSTTLRKLFALRIHTDVGVTGEYVGGSSPAAAQINLVANYLIGKNPLERERHWSELKRALRKYDRLGMGPLDIALWDFAGKHYQAPIHELLGSYRDQIPTYASTYHGDTHGGLDSPVAFADFAEECLGRGFTAFKIHGWGGTNGRRDIDREVETVHEVGERVGQEMNLMLDPACEYETFADALTVGQACDDEGFFWYEDPYRDGGLSQYSHRKLSAMLETPIVPTEHIRGLETLTDFVANGGTELIRVDPEHNAGITGAMKAAHMAEGFGLDVEFHGPGPAKRHCIAATRNSNYYELALIHPDCQNTTPPVYDDDYTDRMDTVDEEGYVTVPDGPGLGVKYDWGYIEDHRTGSRTYT